MKIGGDRFCPPFDPPDSGRMRPSNDQSRSTLSGILVLDKPIRMSSMAAVAAVRLRAAGGDRKLAKKIKVGHAGTLDPLATGVLVVAVGRATKFIDRLMSTDKRYHTAIDLSAFTTTDDREGERTEIDMLQPPQESRVRDVLLSFVGPIMQKPPAFSAMKINGKRAYKLARGGAPVDLPARPVCVHSLELLSYGWPALELHIHCAKGFYVRSLARDLGQALGAGGHCTSIRRTAVGPFTLDMAHQLENLPTELLQRDLISIEDAIELLGSSRA